jgi:hypothetical protein
VKTFAVSSYTWPRRARASATETGSWPGCGSCSASRCGDWNLAAEIYHLREPQKIPQVLSPDETRRLLTGASSLKARVMLSLCYGCGLRAGEVVRLKVKHIDSAQKIIRIEQSKGRKDRNVMLSPEMLELLRQWWKARVAFDSRTPIQERWLFPGRRPGQQDQPIGETSAARRPEISPAGGEPAERPHRGDVAHAVCVRPPWSRRNGMSFRHRSASLFAGIALALPVTSVPPNGDAGRRRSLNYRRKCI